MAGRCSALLPRLSVSDDPMAGSGAGSCAVGAVLCISHDGATAGIGAAGAEPRLRLRLLAKGELGLLRSSLMMLGSCSWKKGEGLSGRWAAGTQQTEPIRALTSRCTSPNGLLSSGPPGLLLPAASSLHGFTVASAAAAEGCRGIYGRGAG